MQNLVNMNEESRGSHIDGLSASIFNPDPRLLNHIQIRPCHQQRGVATVGGGNFITQV